MATAIIDTTQYLTFILDGEEFALDIAKVREVLDYTDITKVPRMPEFLRGVINLRGNVVPVVDLKMQLGMATTERGVNTCIIIADVNVGGETVQMGALADSVQEVLELDPKHIEPAPRVGSIKSEFLRGMGKKDEGFLIILDIDKVLSTSEAGHLREAAEAGEAEDAVKLKAAP